MNKKVVLGPRPTAQQRAMPTPDDWVDSRAVGDVPVPQKPKRLTFDVSRELHTAIKTDCAARGRKMNEDIVAMLEARWLPAKK